jgi:serine/threonine protein kinase
MARPPLPALLAAQPMLWIVPTPAAPAEMLPQARQDYLGPPVDAWSLGIVLFAMLAGYLPFHAKEKKVGFEGSSGALATPVALNHHLHMAHNGSGCSCQRRPALHIQLPVLHPADLLA